MFAHQVIEETQKLAKMIREMDPLLSRMIFELNHKIKSAHHFHLGTQSRKNIMKRKFDQPVFTEHCEYLRLPYPTCWIDYFFDDDDDLAPGEIAVPKRGLLVKELEPGSLSMAVYNYMPPGYGIRWMCMPVFFNIIIGPPKPELEGNIQVLPFSSSLTNNPHITPQKLCEDDKMDMLILEQFMLLINSKNIETREIHAAEALNKARRKRGRVELFTYKVLRLKLPGEKQEKRVGSHTDEHNRIHFCRGHFKVYTAEAPLFGRITGLWWWQAHIRGRNREGLVMKDYEVTAP